MALFLPRKAGWNWYKAKATSPSELVFHGSFCGNWCWHVSHFHERHWPCLHFLVTISVGSSRLPQFISVSAHNDACCCDFCGCGTTLPSCQLWKSCVLSCVLCMLCHRNCLCRNIFWWMVCSCANLSAFEFPLILCIRCCLVCFEWGASFGSEWCGGWVAICALVWGTQFVFIVNLVSSVIHILLRIQTLLCHVASTLRFVCCNVCP